MNWYKKTQKNYYYGSNNSNLKSGKDLEDGHRGYFLSVDPNVAKKFGDFLYKAEVVVNNTFDAKNDIQLDIFMDTLKKYKNFENPETKDRIRQGLKRGNFPLYEDNLVTYALEDSGYDSNWQKEDNSDVLRIFDKGKIINFTRI